MLFHWTRETIVPSQIPSLDINSIMKTKVSCSLGFLIMGFPVPLESTGACTVSQQLLDFQALFHIAGFI